MISRACSGSVSLRFRPSLRIRRTLSDKIRPASSAERSSGSLRSRTSEIPAEAAGSSAQALIRDAGSGLRPSFQAGNRAPAIIRQVSSEKSAGSRYSTSFSGWPFSETAHPRTSLSSSASPEERTGLRSGSSGTSNPSSKSNVLRFTILPRESTDHRLMVRYCPQKKLALLRTVTL